MAKIPFLSVFTYLLQEACDKECFSKFAKNQCHLILFCCTVLYVHIYVCTYYVRGFFLQTDKSETRMSPNIL